ncbi:MAG TPA: aminotransferase class V-fold PLP-dependent enzyme [Steroidobacteraceae bacterium]|nr:aminotransferase class V-fold PLP-dependent enzyme [Steroidobacteraceae bacterium]
MTASFLTGPVSVRNEVRMAFCAPPVSHRTPEFLAMMRRTRDSLASLVNAAHVTLMVGSGTLANDAVGAQIRGFGEFGLILSNGEFGERLIDHANRWGLQFAVERQPRGHAFDWSQVCARAQRARPAWIWAVLTETSTGVANPLTRLRDLARQSGADLCLDAVSAVGLMPVNLDGIRFATAVSGKGLAAMPGIAAVFHDGRLAAPQAVPRYLDLATYEAADGVPFTHSSNLLAALECAVTSTRWADKFARVRRQTFELRAALRAHGLAPLARDADAAPGVVTLPLGDEVRAADVAHALLESGIEVAWQSRYLQERNWLQIALMGEVDEDAVRRLPGALANLLTPQPVISGLTACSHSPSG